MNRTAVTALSAVFSFSLVALGGCHVSPPASSDGSSPFPPAGVDHLGMRVTLDVEISGIGRDTVTLEGTVAVHRGAGSGTGGATMKGELIAASLRGRSEVFGDIVAVESPIRHSPCSYVFEGASGYRGSFDIHGWFWIPRHEIVAFSEQPVPIAGPAAAIPPVGQKATMSVDEVALHSFAHSSGNPIGTLYSATGELTTLVDADTSLAMPEATVSALLGR